jgi:hypothetical protein
MNIQIKAIASDLWEVYDLDKPGDDQIVGSAPTEVEAEDLANQYESESAKPE